ncbi:MAG: TlpA family protein disulfide reductase [Planctomycetes bacterium]|nr:TlpA family protein disulfide reductase [Planctomycetota bacterium]
MNSIRRILPLRIFSVAAVTFAVLLAVILHCLSIAEDANNQESTADGKKKAIKARKPGEKDPYAVPEGKPEKLQAFIKSLLQAPPQDRKDVPKVLRALIQACDKILAAKADEPTRIFAVRIKFDVLSWQAESGDKQATKILARFAKNLEKDKSKEIRELALTQLLIGRAVQIPTLDNKQREKLAVDAVAFVKQGEIMSRMGVAIQIAESFETNNRPDDAASLYLKLAELISKSGDKKAADFVPKLQGYARKLTLLGKKMDVKGTTVDGKPFDWSRYKGKVVLIDFWATWCRPCIFELPNVKRNYELYHQQGFEIVGISLDSRKSDLKAFLKQQAIPWTNLFGTDEKNRGWEHPMAVYYGVTGIPNVILVDRTGKVVSTNAHGQELGRLLKKLLGPPAAEKPKNKTGKKSSKTGKN